MPAATVVNVALNFIRDNLAGAQAIPLKATYFAIGTGTFSGTPLLSTALTTEVFRKAVTQYANGANPGEGLINCYLGPSDSVGTVITEIGLFGGAATATLNSGTLIFYAAYSHTHTGLESIQFQFDSTI
jgi:hypothetical protein